MPSPPTKSGNNKTEPSSKIKVRHTEMIAEIKPLLRAVKNEDEKMAMPTTRNDNALMRIARAARAMSSSSPRAKIIAKGRAKHPQSKHMLT